MHRPTRLSSVYSEPVAKRGYTRDTIRGGASEWDVSRPFSSYARTLATLLVHPVRFFEVLPRIPDIRAPSLFLIFSGIPAAIVWLLFWGLYPALVASYCRCRSRSSSPACTISASSAAGTD